MLAAVQLGRAGFALPSEPSTQAQLLHPLGQTAGDRLIRYGSEQCPELFRYCLGYEVPHWRCAQWTRITSRSSPENGLRAACGAPSEGVRKYIINHTMLMCLFCAFVFWRKSDAL